MMRICDSRQPRIGDAVRPGSQAGQRNGRSARRLKPLSGWNAAWNEGSKGRHGAGGVAGARQPLARWRYSDHVHTVSGEVSHGPMWACRTA